MSNITDNNQHYNGVMLEKIYDIIQTILEAVVPLRQDIAEMKKDVERIPRIEADIQTIKAAARDTNAQVKNHEHRIARLERSKLSKML